MADNELVGPGRPPKHSRWKKGQSGNPRGRPKGRLSMKLFLEEELSELMTLATPRGEREMTKLQAVIRRLIHEALSGKIQAIQDILDRAERLEVGPDDAGAVELTTEDEAILRRALGARDGATRDPADVNVCQEDDLQKGDHQEDDLDGSDPEEGDQREGGDD